MATRRIALATQHKVLRARELGDQAALQSICGDVREPCLRVRAGAEPGHVAAGHEHPAGPGRAEPCEAFDQLVLAVSLHPRHAHDLAGADRQRHAAHGMQPAGVECLQLARLQHHVACGARPARRQRRRHAADHHLGHGLHAQLARRTAPHDTPQAHHRDAVGEGFHLGELVCDEHDGRAVRAQLAQDAEQLVHLLRRQDGRRLVEDEHARAVIERLEDLHPLLLAHGQPGHARVRVHG